MEKLRSMRLILIDNEKKFSRKSWSLSMRVRKESYRKVISICSSMEDKRFKASSLNRRIDFAMKSLISMEK